MLSRLAAALRASASCSFWVASRSACAWAMRASRDTAAACGRARFLMYPVGSWISWTCSESTMSPSFSISEAADGLDPGQHQGALAGDDAEAHALAGPLWRRVLAKPGDHQRLVRLGDPPHQLEDSE